MKGHNFSLREQKQGGQVNNYFQTSHNKTFGEIGNPNSIRSKIPDGQLADNRSAHYYLGFDRNSFTARGVGNQTTFESSRNAGKNQSQSTNVSRVPTSKMLTGADIAGA